MPLLKTIRITNKNYNLPNDWKNRLHSDKERRSPGQRSNLHNNFFCTSITTIFSSKAACSPFFTYLRGSMTVEAAICVPVIIFAVLLMLFPLRVMETERQLQNNMEQTAKYIIMSDYAESLAEEFLKSRVECQELLSESFAGVSEAIGLTAITSKALNTGYFSYFIADPETKWLSDEENDDPAMIYIKFNYALDLPFSLFDITTITKSIVTNRRAWVGASGGRGRETYSSGRDGQSDESGTGTDEEQMVYVGKTSTSVYHLSTECHYLSNTTLTADASEMSSKRNSSGGTYHACSSCNPGTSGTVYYFESGTAYHSSPECSAITSYAKCIPLSETEGMHVCSYCEKHYS